MSEKNKQNQTQEKINWVEIKKEFLLSPEEHATIFLQKKLGIDKTTSHQRVKMKGWGEEKKSIVQEGITQAHDQLKEQIKSAYEVPIEQLNNLKKGIFDVLLARLSQITQKVKMEIDPATGKKTLVVMGDIPTKELVDILKVVKTELGEATNINQAQLGDEEKKIAREIGSIKII